MQIIGPSFCVLGCDISHIDLLVYYILYIYIQCIYTYSSTWLEITVMTTSPGHRFWYPIGWTIWSGGCTGQLHETIWPRDCAAARFDLMHVVHNYTIVWSLFPVARDRHLTWESSQLCETDIWSGNLLSCMRQTLRHIFDLGIGWPCDLAICVIYVCPY